jgi:hypothetical protein
VGFASTGVVAAGSAAGAAAAAAVVGASTGGGIGTGVIVAGAAVVAAGAAVAAKSGGEDSPSTSTSPSAPIPTPTPTPSATMAGHWVGQISLSGTTCITDITYDFTQTGNAFSGSGATSRRVAAGCTALNGTIENAAGTLTGNSFTFTDRFVTGSQFCGESTTGTLSGNQATGTSVGTGQGTGPCNTSGTFTITRQ